jgi:hypothetical protein
VGNQIPMHENTEIFISETENDYHIQLTIVLENPNCCS